MINIARLWVAFALLAGTAGCRPTPAAHAPSVAETPAFRIVSYNIRAGTDLQGRPSIERVAALLDSLAPDVVFLQEVDRGTNRSGGVDQLRELTRLTGMHGYFARTIEFDGGEFGTALLSRAPVDSARTVPLSVNVPAEVTELPYEPRALLHAVITTAGGPVHLLGTHLDHYGPPIFRHPQLFAILSHLADQVPPGARVVFAGDLNAEPGAPEIRALSLHFADAWAACGQGDGHTFPSDTPARRIDYVLLRGVPCTSAEVISTRLSDHRPVVVDVAW